MIVCVCVKELCGGMSRLFCVQNGRVNVLRENTTMPHPRAASIIRALVCEFYGIRGMPMTVLKKEDAIDAYEADHPEVPPELWDFVQHDVRLVRNWARADLNVELVVWVPNSESYRLVQDVCFRDAYPDAATWHRAVFELVKASPEVWVVTHGDDLHATPSAWS